MQGLEEKLRDTSLRFGGELGLGPERGTSWVTIENFNR